MKVLHVITGLAAGGAEQQLRLLCRYLDAECEVAVLTTPGIVADQLRTDGLPVHEMRMRGNRDLLVLVRLVRLIRRRRPDVVHTHLFRAGLYGRLAARLARVAVVVATEHSLGDLLLEGRHVDHPGVRLLYRLGEALGDRTIAVSATVARRMWARGVPPDQIAIVPNGVDAERLAFSVPARARLRAEWGVDDATTVVGCVGRLVATKRFDLAVGALVDAPNHQLVLVGDGPAAAELRESAARLHVADRVRFLGEVGDVAPALSAMDVFLSPCPEETYGLSVLEALAAGLPTVYVACPALEEHSALAAPNAHATTTAPTDIDRTLRLALASAAPRRAPAPVLAFYDIADVACQVKHVYEQVGQRRSRLPARDRAVRGEEDS